MIMNSLSGLRPDERLGLRTFAKRLVVRIKVKKRV
jgi:hypothetical protein